MLRSFFPAFIVVLTLLMAGVSGASDFVVANGWVNLPIFEEDPPAYLVIQNKGGKARKLVGGTCTGCTSIEIHRAVLKDGAMVSEVLPEWEIPAGGAVSFAPRGIFLTLVGAKDLEVDAKIEIELEFSDGEKLSFEAVIREE